MNGFNESKYFPLLNEHLYSHNKTTIFSLQVLSNPLFKVFTIIFIYLVVQASISLTVERFVTFERN